MSETMIGTLASVAVALLAVVCLLYMLGGRSGKWKRRFVASFIAFVNVNGISLMIGNWGYWLLAIFPCLSIGFSLGYGSDVLLTKVLKRAICAIAVCTAGVFCCLQYGGNAWFILPLHIGVGLWSIWLGVKNPVQAAAEEVFVCLLLNAGLIMYPFVTLRG